MNRRPRFCAGLLAKPASGRGQAMLEYTMVTHALLLAGTVAAWPFLSYMMRSLGVYFQSIYYVLNAPVP